MPAIQDQIEQLKALLPKLGPRDQEFAIDLIAAQKKYGKLTPKQEPWIGKLIERAMTPKVEVPKIDVGSFEGVVTLFKKAQEHLKYPKIVLQCGGQPVWMNLAGPQSKIPGSINVQGEGKYPDRPWFGRVMPDGKWQPSKGMTPEFQTELQALLVKFAKNPARVAKEYGKLTGNCCFCQSQLSEEHSIAAGFGPVCADRYGLKAEWKTAVQKASIEKMAGDFKKVAEVPVQPIVQPIAPPVVDEVQSQTVCLMCEVKPGVVLKNGYMICADCAHELEM